VPLDIVIVGAGAAGLATAIFTRRDHPDVRVRLVDGARKPGAKILVSGGSRCNVTNVRVNERDFSGGSPAAIRQVLRGLPVPETVAFFRELGVTLHEEAHGKLFPDTNRARDVLDALLAEAARRGVERIDECRVGAIGTSDGRFTLDTTRGMLRADRVVLATGGLSLPKSGSDGAGFAIARTLGHTIVPPVPALVPLVLAPGAPLSHEALSGVAHDVELAVWIDRRVQVRIQGSLLWTHVGISGPAALDASRHWARARDEGRDARITLSLCPGQTFDTVDDRLVALFASRPKASLRTTLTPLAPAAVVEGLLHAVRAPEGAAAGTLSREVRRQLAHALVEWPLPVLDTRGYTFAEVTAGGVNLSEINPRTMGSRVCPGLFLVGEVLDVDGRLGGFNFQWAWASARVAARALGAPQSS
jgi:predicted Rossmann fold flavoprotein